MAIADGFLGGFPNLATWSGVVCRVKTQLQKGLRRMGADLFIHPSKKSD